MGNDMMTRYAYDPLTYRLLRIRTEKYEEDHHVYEPQSGTTKQDSGYEYDLGGNIVKIKERVTDCGINGSLLGVDALDRTFTYDPLKRLLTATGRESNTTGNTNFWGEKGAPGTPNANNTRAYTQSYQYDGAGNIQQLAHAASGNSYTRHYRYPEFYRLGQVDNGGSPTTVHASFLYDANGNQVKINTDRYFLWDAFDQLRHFRIDDGTTVSVAAQYLYAGGARVKKLVQDQFGNVQVTVYIDGVYEHRYTKDSVGDVQEEQTMLHVMDGRSRIATVRMGDTMDDTGPAVKYNLEDHLGTSTTRLTEDGTVIDREEYYPFGDSSLRTFDKKRYRYVGKEKDNESGLYYYGMRYYAPWICRFVSVDPLAKDYPYLTPYNYAGNKPIGDLDVDGMQSTGDPPVKKDPRIRDDGKNVKNGPYTKDETSYMISNLPCDPQPGQIATFYYANNQTGTGIGQVDWVFDQTADTWSPTYHYTWASGGLEQGSTLTTTFATLACHTPSAAQRDGSPAEGGGDTTSSSALEKIANAGEAVAEVIAENEKYAAPVALISEALSDGLKEAADRLPHPPDNKVPWNINKLNEDYVRKANPQNNRFITLGKIKQSWAKVLAPAARLINKVAPVIGGVATLYESLKDGKVSAGDAARVGLFAVGIAVPVFGLALGAADVIGEYFFGKSLTSKIAETIDSFKLPTLEVSWMKFW